MRILSRYILLLIALIAVQACDKETIVPPGDAPPYVEVFHLPSLEDNIAWVHCGTIVRLDAGVDSASYLWSPGGETTKTIDLDTSATYADLYAVAITTNDSAWIDSAIIVQDNGSYLWDVPNFFTPNNDGANDVFFIYASCTIDFKLTIFNTSNSQKIFESENISVGWDGTYNGEEVAMGEYPYNIEITFANFQSITDRGTVQVLR